MADQSEKLEKDDQAYVPVDVTQLKEGMIVDRPLYAKMDSRKKFILMARALHPLEAKVLEKFQRFGHVYSTKPPIEERYPKLASSVHKVGELLSDSEAAPFERAALIRKETLWIARGVFAPDPDFYAPVFFVSRAFNVPKPETIHFVSELSIDLTEKALKMSALAGMIGLWLDYNSTEWIRSLICGVFCEELSLFREDSPNLRKIALAGDRYAIQDSDRAFSLELLKRGEIPGISKLELNVDGTIRNRSKLLDFGIEAAEMIEMAAALYKKTVNPNESFSDSRVSKKLKELFSEASLSEEVEAA